jgi:hypothetical protein
MSNAYQYDVFISYANKDAEWAKRLYDDLAQKNLTPFLAPQSIRKGTQWEQELYQKLQSSQHFLVLWSNEARDSGDYVLEEITKFKDIARNEPSRLLLQVPLEGEYKPLQAFQKITELRDANAYKDGVQWINVNQAVWLRVVEMIEEEINTDSAALPIHVLVLAMNAIEAEKALKASRGGEAPPQGIGLVDVLKELEIPDAAFLSSYDADRRDWKPFCGSDKIRTVLDQLRVQLARKTDTSFRLKYLEERFWSPQSAEAEAEAGKLSKNLALIVVDPLSLYDGRVKSRFDYLEGAFRNPHAVVLTLSPVPVHAKTTSLRTLVNNMAVRIFNRFYEPFPLEDGFAAKCCAITADEVEARRWLLETFRDYQTSRKQPKPTTTPYF